VFIRLWVNIVALLAVVLLVPGIRVDNFQTALLAALALGLANTFLRPALIAFTLPINILSLGFFTLLINGFLFFLVSRIVPGFVVLSFWNAVWGALAFSIFNFILNLLLKPSGSIKTRFFYKAGGRTRGQTSGQSRRDNVIDIEGKVDEGADDKHALPH
jgi:putative membrane protein